METRWIERGNRRIAYIEAGTGNVPFVLVHGFTGGKLDFQDQIPWFAANRRVVAADHRGHGESGRLENAAAYTLDALESDLVTFLDSMHITRCDLLGHSMGGAVAMKFALRHPDRLHSLVLMDTSAEPMVFSRQPSDREALAKRVREKGCSSLVEPQRHAAPLPGVKSGIDFLGEAEHWRRIEWKMSRMDPEAFVGLLEDMARHNLLEQLSAIRCPTTVLVGEHDRPFIEPSGRMATKIPGARHVTIPDAAHCPQYENAAVWREAIETHLTWASGF